MGHDDEFLWRAPLNSPGPPRGRESVHNTGSDREHVLARLVWPRDRVQVVPAEAIAWARDRVLVQWWPSSRSRKPRWTWLPRDDVQDSLRWVIRRSPG